MPKTPEEVEAALAAEMEVTHQLAHEVDSIADRQAAPDVIALELNRERELRGQAPAAEQEEKMETEEKEEPAEEEKAGSNNKKRQKKRPREDEGEPQAEEQAEAPAGSGEKRRKKKAAKKHKANAAEEARKQDEHPEIAAFHEEVRNTSMDMVQARIPAKIIEVHALYKKLVSEMKPLGETIEASDVTPHYASNSRTKELVALVKAQIAELVDIAGSVRLWLQFSIPPAGGQDFDAKIKEEIANELEHVNATGQSVIQTLKNFPISRGLLLAQITKRQNVEDFRVGLPYLDFHHQMMLQRWVKDLRNMYLSLNNTLKQNVAELAQAGNPSGSTRRGRLSDSLSPPTARRQPQGRGSSTSRRNSSSRYTSPFK